MISPSPGPTLEIALAAPEIEVSKSRPVKDNSSDMKRNMNKKEKMNIITELIKFSEIF
tara:strand:- start:41 stop:214 length:174 start_codon:yes stop_codon:yes gene_type:complete